MKGALLLGLALCMNAMGADVKTEFNKRFKVVEQDGKVQAVKMKLFTGGFKIKPYLMELKREVREELLRLDSKAGEGEYQEFLSELATADKAEGDPNVVLTDEAIQKIKTENLDQAFEAIQEGGILEQFERDMNGALLNFDLGVIANLDDSRFFYRRAVTYEIVVKILDMLKKRFSDIPVLNLASFVVVKVHDMILEQRTFHQNMLLYYLEKHENELPFAHAEVNHMFSSIYESKIAATNFMESRTAVETWGTYGTDKFFSLVRGVNNRIRDIYMNQSDVLGKVSYGFIIAMEEGKKVIKNMVDNKHQFSFKPATAYYFDEPGKVKRTRSLLNLGQLALGFLPINGEIKGFAQNFIGSFYEKQRLTEGALVAYLLINDYEQLAKEIRAQNINPFIMMAE